MHPFEHLRYVARSGGADVGALVHETAAALGSMGHDRSNLVIACRRILERHPAVGPLWWLCTEVVLADEPIERAWELVDEFGRDRTARVVAEVLAADSTVATIGWPKVAGDAVMRRGDVTVLCADSGHVASSFMQRLERVDVGCEPVLTESLAVAVRAADVAMVEAVAATDGRFLCPVGSHVLAAVAASVDTPVWIVAGLGRRLPSDYVDAIADRVASSDSTWDVTIDDVPASLITHAASADGVVPCSRSAWRSDVPVAAELLRTSPF